jgi:hypothetical protein
MIPTLLWQCPLCHTDDALVHKVYWFRADEVRCKHCETVWVVQRVIGSDYLLTVTQGVPEKIGWQQPLAAWYDLMKAGLKLSPQEPPLDLEPGEEIYVWSRGARLFVEEDSRLFHQWSEMEAPSQKEGALGLSFMRPCDRGRLFLTSERLIWLGEHSTLHFSLRRVNSVHTEVTWYLGLLYGLCLYKFSFDEESILKWLTYIALAAKRIQDVYQHRIAVSNY